MGKNHEKNETAIDAKTTCRAGLAVDSDELSGILSGRTEKIPFPRLKSAISKTLTRKADNKYKHPEKIGHGGMKQILKVRDRDTARNLAMAILSNDSDVQEACMARFVYEARITANLEHPNIVPIHDIGIDKAGQPYFTMKLIEGESLAHILMSVAKKIPEYVEKYNLPHLLTIFLNVCNAIDFAHSKGIIHLDLKPENIQIGNYGEVLVLDWGLARLIDDMDADSLTPESSKDLLNISESDLDKTVDGEIKGTPGFMAPEQAAGINSKKNTTTDIYALGSILYSILTLKKPIKGTELNDILDKTINGELIPPAQRSPERNIPAPLVAVTMKAMELKQENRYQSVDELIKDIDAYTGDFATSAEKATFFRHFKLYLKRHKNEVYFGIFGVVAIIAAIAIFAIYETKRLGQWGRGRDISPRSKAELKENWIPVAGNWQIKNGSIYAEPGKGNSFILLHKKPVYGNLAIEFNAEIPNPEDLQDSGDLSVIMAASRKDPKERGYFLQVGGIGNTSAVIQKRGGLMAAVEFSLKPQKKYKIRAEKEGQTLRLFCDGKLLITSKDIFYLEGGYIGLYTFGKGKKFNNIRIFQKDVPELVPPTIEGDSFYRESRNASGKEKEAFLQLAKKAYSRVYESELNSELSSQAILKRAYVNSELNDTPEALRDIILLEGYGETLDLLLLKGLHFFRSDQFEDAYNIYAKALEKYPESKVMTIAILMGNLSSEISQQIPSGLRQKFWALCAENHTSPVFRCSSRNLESLEFLNGTKFSLIDCSNNKISSLAPLKNVQLQQLDCADNQITSLEPLQNMQLISLECHNNPITDITPLKGMPLKTLSLSGCNQLKDISALKDFTHLERLTVPKQIKDLQFLRHLPNLKYLNDEWDDWKMTKEKFFRKNK